MNVLSIPTLMITLIMTIYYFRINRDYLNPGVIFNAAWSFAVVLQMINTNGYYPISEYTYAVIMAGILFVNIGMMARGTKVRSGSICENGNSIETSTNQNIENNLRYKKAGKKIFYIQLIMVCLLLPLVLRALQFQARYGMAMMRTVYADGVNYGYMSTFERILYIHVGVFPLNMACILLQTILCVHGHSKFRYLFLGMINEFFRVIIASSRGNLFYIAIFIVAGIMIGNYPVGDKVIKYYKKIKRWMKYLIIALIAAIVIITYVRHRMSASDSNVILNLLNVLGTYFAGGFQLFDLALNNPATFGLNRYTFGTCTISGLISAANYFVYYLLSGRRISLNSLNATTQIYAAEFYKVSDTKSMNAYVTMFYYFMRDFGWIGVIIISIIVGYIFAGLYKKMKRKNDIKNQYIYCMIVCVLIFSSLWWVPIQSDFWMMLLYGMLLMKFINR